MSKKWKHVYVIFRVDLDLIKNLQDTNWNFAITIKSVFSDAETAETEVTRLNNLVIDGQTKYFWQSAKSEFDS